MNEHIQTDPPRSRPHCPGCTCDNRRLDTIGIYPPHERFYGRCTTCGQVRWETIYNVAGRGEGHKTTHCGCCTHRHNLPNGGHDARCLADERNCVLLKPDGTPVFDSINYPGPQ